MPDRDTVISMARSAGMTGGTQLITDASSLEIFAALVAAQEREQCAQAVERHAKVAWNHESGILEAALVIRAMGERT